MLNIKIIKFSEMDKFLLRKFKGTDYYFYPSKNTRKNKEYKEALSKGIFDECGSIAHLTVDGIIYVKDLKKGVK